MKRLQEQKKIVLSGETDKILSNENFNRIKESKVCDYEILITFLYFFFSDTFSLVFCSNLTHADGKGEFTMHKYWFATVLLLDLKSII
jgi:hypothetical protein